MIPKEKAKELVEKFMPFTIKVNIQFPEHHAKQCALIAVDEIIKDYKGGLENWVIDFISNPNPIEYWEQVKQAINEI